MTFPPMRCQTCGGEGEIDFDRVRDERNEVVCTICPDCEGTGIEPDDDDDTDDPDDEN